MVAKGECLLLWGSTGLCLTRLAFSGAGKGGPSKMKRALAEDLANESRSTHITVAADMVFSLSHYLSGVSILSTSTERYEELTNVSSDRHCRLRSSSERRFLGRDPIVRSLAASEDVQLAKARGHFVLQYGSYPYGVVEYVDDIGRTLQSSESCIALQTFCLLNGCLLGVLPQQSSCRLLRTRCPTSTGHAVLGKGGIGALQVPEGFPQALRIRHDP